MSSDKYCRYIPFIGVVLILALLPACSGSGNIEFFASPTASALATVTSSQTSAFTLTQTIIPTATNTATKTPTPTKTDVPSTASTPTVTSAPTIDFPKVTVNVPNAHCRFGPGAAYLHAADLHEGDHGLIWNRNHNGTWLWVRFDKLSYACWVAASVVETEGDVFSVSAYFPPLPKSTLYGPPKKMVAAREGDQVVVSWERVWMTEDDDRGYLIEARLCQNGYLFDTAVHTDGTSYTFTDESTCEGESKAKLYTVEKHGYSDPVQIPWP